MAIKVKKNEGSPESKEILAEAIIRIGDSFKALQDSGLNERAIVLLVSDASRVNRTEVIEVLKALRTLRGYYCRN